MIVNGKGRGLTAELIAIHEDHYNCDIKLRTPQSEHLRRLSGLVIKGVDYEDVCKIA